jgi:ABC-type multidrug transport system fused ATPase/permease subunit
MKTDFARRFFRMGYSYTLYLLLSEIALMVMKLPAASWLAMLVMLALFASSYILRENVRRLWPLLLLAALSCLGIWFLPEVMLQKLLLMGLAIGLLCTGARHVMSGGALPEPQDIPWPGILMALVGTGVALYYELPDLIIYSVVLAGLNIFFFLMVIYSDGVRRYIDATREVKGMPIRKMIHVNTWIVMGIFLVMGIGILLGELLGLPGGVEELLKSLGHLIKALFYGVGLFFQWLVNLLGFGNGFSASESSEQIAQELEKSGVGGNIIFVILRVIVILFVLVVVIKVFAYLIRIFMAKFQKGEKETVRENLKTDFAEKLKDRDILSRVKKYLSPEEKARRIYRKEVLSAMGGESLPVSVTTGDIVEILKERNVDLTELTRLYDAVRYGGVTVDRAYLGKMKKVAKNRNKEGAD